MSTECFIHSFPLVTHYAATVHHAVYLATDKECNRDSQILDSGQNGGNGCIACLRKRPINSFAVLMSNGDGLLVVDLVARFGERQLECSFGYYI